MPSPARPVRGVHGRHEALASPQEPHYLTLFVTSRPLVWFHRL